MLFKDIIGQEAVKRHLIENVKHGFIPHAQIFAGNEGVGKLPLALAYAQYLNCTNKKGGDSCGTCPSCIKYNKLIHPDLHFVFPIYKNKKREICDDFLTEWREMLLKNPYFTYHEWMQSIQAGNAQGMIYEKESGEILHKLSLKTYESEFKTMIIWLPETMHPNCSNKLLKLIEEPPSKTVFLFITENQEKVLGTILSRSQMLHVPNLSDSEMEAAAKERFGLEGESAGLLVHLSKGSFTKAEELMGKKKENEYFLSLFITIMRNSWTRNVINMKEKAKEFATLGRETEKAFLSYAQKMIRENFFYPLDIPDIIYLNKEETAFSKNFSPYINERNIREFMTELESAERDIEQNVNPRMVFFDLSMKIAVLLKK